MRFAGRALPASALALLLCAGCAQLNRGGANRPTNTGRTPPSPSVYPRDYGPSYSTFEAGGLKWVRGSMAFPTGRPESSGLLVEKTVPAEVLVGQPLDFAYKVSNLLDSPIHMVTLMDRVSGSINPADADPKPSETRDGISTWQLGTLGPKETKTIHVKGMARQVGSITTCGWATYSPILCEDIRVVKADMHLTLTVPDETPICEPIPVTLTVKNTGSSTLNGIKVVDTLPEGLTSNQRTSVTFEAGTLMPGQSREFKFTANASRPGTFIHAAKASSVQGLATEGTASTKVKQPALSLACKAPEERFAGRPFDVCYTVTNISDAISTGTILELPIPTGLTMKSAAGGGRARAGIVMWDFGSLGPNAAKEVCATFISASAGNITFNGTVKSACVPAVAASCQTRVVGVAAILLEKTDDPDPIGVGETTTYTVRITNQGTADDTNVRTVITIPPELVPVSATGGGIIESQTISFPSLPRLAPKEVITYKVIAKGVKAGDGRTRFVLTSDILKSPVTAEESTRVY